MTKTKFYSLLIIVALFFSYSLVFSPASAQDPQIPEDTIKESIKERLEKVSRQESESGEVLAQKSTKRAWVGSLEDIAGETLTIKTRSQTKLAKISQDATIVDKNRKTIQLKNLEIGSFVIAMGYLDNNQVLDTKRVVVIQELEPTPINAYLVKVSQIEDETLTVQNTTDQNQSWQLNLTSKTIITQTVNGEQSAIKLSDIQESDQLVIIAQPDPKAPTVLDTTAIHLATKRSVPNQASPSPKPEN